MGQALSLALFEGRNTSVALGFFDGFHKGHQAIVAQACVGPLLPVVFTLKNHPATVVDSTRAPRLINTFRERLERLLSSGATVVWTEFDRPFSLLEPDTFVRTILLDRLGAGRVVVGANYHYGHRAAGNVESLQSSGREHGFEVVVVEPVSQDGEVISSTRVRCLIEAGEMGAAARLLGAPYTVSAIVQRGAERGRTIGTPTANLELPPGKVVPPYGVYAVWVQRRGGRLRAVANLGVRPTFTSDSEPLLEVHILDGLDYDLYGEFLEVQFVQRLRAEQKFAGIDHLKAQIARDVSQARELL